uniref:SHSP domain-containing protein n=1 Tax=Plectus sambesii TaxID=2011161 RepID=A0A914XIT6_9BILA
MKASTTTKPMPQSIKKKNEVSTSFAHIESLSDRYIFSINLKYFEGFKSDECIVGMKGRDLLIDCCKKQKLNKQTVGSFREVHVIYQLPEDIDATTIRMKRDELKLTIEARRTSYGKPLSLAVCDVTKRGANVQVLSVLA